MGENNFQTLDDKIQLKADLVISSNLWPKGQLRAAIFKLAETVDLILLCYFGDAIRCAVSTDYKMVARNCTLPGSFSITKIMYCQNIKYQMLKKKHLNDDLSFHVNYSSGENFFSPRF